MKLKIGNKTLLASLLALTCLISLVVFIVLLYRSTVQPTLYLQGKVLRQKDPTHWIFVSIVPLNKIRYLKKNQTGQVYFEQAGEKHPIPVTITKISREFTLEDLEPLLYLENISPLTTEQVKDLSGKELDIQILLPKVKLRELL
ncbi:MAG: hypothetical protein HYU97_03360 [Deltaproteobacteria bacterium]|nr:hypothetical protein [Deltaproteobacteria bacterium]